MSRIPEKRTAVQGRTAMRPYIRFAHVDGVFAILAPARRVVSDVPPDGVQFVFVPDDVFVVVALPDGQPRSAPHFVDAFGGNGLKRAHQPAQGLSFRSVCRGGSRTAPTRIANDNDAVKMIRHHHVLIKLDEIIPVCQPTPRFFYHIVKPLIFQQRGTIPTYNRHKIRPGLPVIVGGQANGPSVALGRTVCHLFIKQARGPAPTNLHPPPPPSPARRAARARPAGHGRGSSAPPRPPPPAVLRA